MARIYLSPLIVDIRNKQADTVFSKWRGINYIRSRVVPANPKTAGQVAIREALARLVALWQGFGVNTKDNWKYMMSGREKSGFNHWIGLNTVDEKNDSLLALTLDTGYEEFETFTPSTGSGAGEIDIAFAPTPFPADRKGILYFRKSATSEWDKIGAISAAQNSPITITGLDAGDTYQVYGYIRIEPYDDDGSHVGKSASGTAAAHA
jgi:hypothetical protein